MMRQLVNGIIGLLMLVFLAFYVGVFSQEKGDVELQLVKDHIVVE